MRTQKRRIPVVVVGPHRKHPGASSVTSPLHMLEDAPDAHVSVKMLKKGQKAAVKAIKAGQ